MLQVLSRVCFYSCDLLSGARLCSTSPYENVRVRFAPSPTGYIHLGGLRTALYNYLFAKSKNGVSILRIEDTDQTRIVPGATERIIEDLEWCGIKFDEGPYFQSQRTEIYQKHAQLLVDYNEAYYCFCSPARLDLLRREALKSGEVVKYDNKCRNLSKAEVTEKMNRKETHCIRFKMRDTIKGFNDLIFGYNNEESYKYEGDPIILKSDGFPTYHLANVVDDHLMEISHVLRGSEWLKSTIKHLLMYRAFNWNPPQYGHLPLLLNSDGTKFSKRQNDLRVEHFRDVGIFPNTLINLVTFAGGGFGIASSVRKDKNFSMEELIEMFDLSKINKTSCKLPMEWLERTNHLELVRQMENDRDKKILVDNIKSVVLKHFEERGTDFILQVDSDNILKVLNCILYRIHRLDDLVSEKFLFLWVKPNMKFIEGESMTIIQYKKLLGQLNKQQWDHESLRHVFKDFCKNENIEFPYLMSTIRKLLSGFKEGLPVIEILTMLGKEDSLSRLKTALEK